MVVFAGQGDARRSMDLLWRGPGRAEGAGAAGDGPDEGRRPGPRPALSVPVIVDAAISVADAEGMAALSMRAVGERLGRTAMALYTYVPGKGELVDLMYDRALRELPGRYDVAVGWRPALTAWAEDTWAFYARHPWMLQVSQARPVLGPGEYRALEALLGVLAGTGLGAPQVRRAVATLSSVVRGAARTLAEARWAVRATGLSEERWWTGRAELLGELAPGFAQRFPLVAWLHSEDPPGSGAAPDQHPRDACPGEEDAPFLERAARDAFEGGLALVLDGIEAAVAARA